MATFTVMAAINHLGRVVRFHRRKAGLSRKELAKMSGIGKTSIYDIEHDKGTVRLSTILAVLDVLNIQLNLTSPLMNEYETSHS